MSYFFSLILFVYTKTMLAGSPGFQSTEQVRNESMGPPSDVYALGAVILVLFGEAPVWPALLPYQIMCKVAVCQERPKTGHLPPQNSRIVQFADIAYHPPSGNAEHSTMMCVTIIVNTIVTLHDNYNAVCQKCL